MAQVLHLLQAAHEQGSAEFIASPFPGANADQPMADEWVMTHKHGVVRHKYTHPRFLNVLRVPPFAPHTGGWIFPPAELGSPHGIGTPGSLGLVPGSG